LQPLLGGNLDCPEQAHLALVNTQATNSASENDKIAVFLNLFDIKSIHDVGC
jgi:hypothetical protein